MRSPSRPTAGLAASVCKHRGSRVYFEDAEAKSDQTHYFIRFIPETCAGRDIDTIVEDIGGIVYATDNTVGPRSISKNELIGAINDRLKTTKQEDTKSCDCPIL